MNTARGARADETAHRLNALRASTQYMDLNMDPGICGNFSLPYRTHVPYAYGTAALITVPYRDAVPDYEIAITRRAL